MFINVYVSACHQNVNAYYYATIWPLFNVYLVAIITTTSMHFICEQMVVAILFSDVNM